MELPVGLTFRDRVRKSYHLTKYERISIYQLIRIGVPVDEVAYKFNTTDVSVRRVVNALSQGEKMFSRLQHKLETGKVYGLLTVKSWSHSDRGSWFNCQCQCGRVVKIRGFQLRLGKTKSCGCLSKREKYEMKKKVVNE